MTFTQEYLDRAGQRLGIHTYPDPAPDAPVIVFWPAMGVPAGYYRRWAADLGAHGLRVVVPDLRGTGTSSPVASRRTRYGYAELVDDVAAVFDHLKPQLDGRTVLLGGHSLGGQLATLHLAGAGAGSPAHGLVLVAVGLPYFRSYHGRGRLGVYGMTQSINVASAVLGYWPGWAFGGRQARGVVRDWAYTARHGAFPRLDGTDIESALAAVDVPVLAVTVAADAYTPPSTTDQLVGKLARARVERYHYRTEEAGGALDHFRWTRAGGALAGRVRAFADTVR